MPVHGEKPAPGRVVGAASPRVLLARISLARALTADGVSAGDPGPLGVWQTADGDDLLQGVVVTSSRGGRYDVQLHLVASWPTPPLYEVSAAIREDVSSAAEQSGLGELLGALGITFGDLQEPAPAGHPFEGTT